MFNSFLILLIESEIASVLFCTNRIDSAPKWGKVVIHLHKPFPSSTISMGVLFHYLKIGLFRLFVATHQKNRRPSLYMFATFSRTSGHPPKEPPATTISEHLRLSLTIF
ncbi:hypothetical protein HanIR_Chr07g0320721 [Helianthus annuus]|nr:hypothetical protein HanIR_Chr07g0320721 [Helianthus annuus]